MSALTGHSCGHLHFLGSAQMSTPELILVSHPIILHFNFVFNSPGSGGAALTLVFMGLSGDYNEPLVLCSLSQYYCHCCWWAIRLCSSTEQVSSLLSVVVAYIQYFII